MSHEDLSAQALSLRSGVEALDAIIEKLRGDLTVAEADRLGMAQRLGSVERFLDGEGVPLSYSDRKGV